MTELLAYRRVISIFDRVRLDPLTRIRSSNFIPHFSLTNTESLYYILERSNFSTTLAESSQTKHRTALHFRDERNPREIQGKEYSFWWLRAFLQPGAKLDETAKSFGLILVKCFFAPATDPDDLDSTNC